MKKLVALCAMAVAGIAGAGLVSFEYAQAAPEPSVVPISWQLDFKHQAPERLQVTIDGKQQTYWFIRYTVTNNTGKDVLYTPEFELLTDTGAAQVAFKDVDRKIFPKIKELYKNALLESPTGILGKLLQGEDNAKDGVIIFTNLDPDARTFKIFVSGLSGETAEVKNPVTDKPVVLQKTLVLEYNVPGQAIGIDPQPQLKSTTWVMK